MTHHRNLFERITSHVVEGELQTAVLWLPDGTAHDFSGYLSEDPLATSIRQIEIEHQAFEIMQEAGYVRGAFGVALRTDRVAGVLPFSDGHAGQIVVTVFDLDLDDLEVVVMAQPLRVRGDVLEAQEIVRVAMPFENLPPDTPGLLLIKELARNYGKEDR